MADSSKTAQGAWTECYTAMIALSPFTLPRLLKKKTGCLLAAKENTTRLTKRVSVENAPPSTKGAILR